MNRAAYLEAWPFVHLITGTAVKISNASEVVAAKVGRFLERLTPDSIDQAAVEDQVINKLIENLAAEGLKGEIAAINGLDLEGSDLSFHKELKVRKHTSF